MRTISAVGLVGMMALGACGGVPAATRGPLLPAATGSLAAPEAVAPATGPAAAQAGAPAAAAAAPQGPWVGAAAESDVLLARGGEAFVGVWVDVPASAGAAGRARAHGRAPVDLALVIDTSGSMEGERSRAARESARTMVQRLADGDVLSVDTFSDHARTLVPPTMLTPKTRASALSAIAELGTGGSTNMFEGLELAEMHVALAAQTAAIPGVSPVRRIVLISDGQANVGPSSPQALADLAQHGLDLGAQVTSLGVGLDYDERTLDAIAERTSGRLFHVGDPREMTATLQQEVDTLAATVANQAQIEIVPAPGVVVVGVDGARVEAGEGEYVRIPLGALYAGQHRDALVRVRLTQGAAGGPRALASVRLKFRNPAESEVERVQEVLARAQTSDNPVAVAEHANAKTHAMMAMIDAAKIQIQAAQDIGVGSFGKAETQLAQAERKLDEEVARTKDDSAREKLKAAKQSVARARAAANAAPAAAPADVRRDVLEMNSAGMKAMGM